MGQITSGRDTGDVLGRGKGRTTVVNVRVLCAVVSALAIADVVATFSTTTIHVCNAALISLIISFVGSLDEISE